MRHLPALPILAAVLALGLPTAKAATFGDYPAVVAGPPYGAPDFAGKARDHASHRTRFTEGSAKDPDFGGKYVLVSIGCGAGCRFGGAVDRKTGAIVSLPIGGEEYRNTQLYSRADSRLLKVTWTEGLFETETCHIGEFVLEGEEFRELRRWRHEPVEDCLKGPEG